MSEPAASFLSRSGIRSYLRRILGIPDVSGVALAADIAREVGRATKTLRVDVDNLKEEHRQFRQELRDRQHQLQQDIEQLRSMLGASGRERPDK